MQSEPVSPPPITRTFLPVAMMARALVDRLAADAAVLLRQELHRVVDAGELAARHRQIARHLGADGEHHRVVLVHQPLDRHVDADMQLGWNSTPSARICAMRRSMVNFSSLKSGMP